MDPSDRALLSAIAHTDRRFAAPIDGDRFEIVVAALEPVREPMVLDIGCGKGEALRRIVARWGGHGMGIDLSAGAVDEACRLNAGAAIEVQVADARDLDLAAESFDVGVCIGSTHAFGSLAATLPALARLVRAGGRVVIGEGYWKQDPPQDGLDAFGMHRDELDSLERLVGRFEEAGLVPVLVQPSTDSEWDSYEWAWVRSVERWAAANPDDQRRDAFVAEAHVMRDSWLSWRRDAMGFALVVADVEVTRTG